MAEKMKLELEELKGQSFVTTLGTLDIRNLKGGIEPYTLAQGCTEAQDCTNFACTGNCTGGVCTQGQKGCNTDEPNCP